MKISSLLAAVLAVLIVLPMPALVQTSYSADSSGNSSVSTPSGEAADMTTRGATTQEEKAETKKEKKTKKKKTKKKKTTEEGDATRGGEAPASGMQKSGGY